MKKLMYLWVFLEVPYSKNINYWHLWDDSHSKGKVRKNDFFDNQKEKLGKKGKRNARIKATLSFIDPPFSLMSQLSLGLFFFLYIKSTLLGIRRQFFIH